MNIKAAVARAHGAPLVIEGLDLDGPRPDEIVVRLVAAGVARVDLDAIAGALPMPLPFVPGSEAAGIVEHAGADVTDLAAGDAVLVGYGFCGACAACDSGSPGACVAFAALNLRGCRADGSTPFGSINGFFFGQSAFATHLVCRAASAIKLPMGAPLEILAALGGELLVGAALILNTFDMTEDDRLVVTGADAVGLVACMAAKARGVGTIIVADPDAARRDLATACGATIVVHTDDDLPSVVKSLVADGVSHALDTTGHAAAIDACLASLAANGPCALLRTPSSMPAPPDRGRTLLLPSDIAAAPDTLVPALAAMQARGDLPIDLLIDFFPFDRVNDALAAQAAGAVPKAVLRFPLGSFGALDRALTEGVEKTADEPVRDTPEPQPAVPVTA